MKRVIIFFFSMFFFILLLPLSKAVTTDTIGGTTATYDYFGAQQAHSITASASGILTTLGMNIDSASGNIRLAIYSNGAGKPANLLGESSSTIATAGWNDLTIPGGVSIVASTTYWIAYQQDTGACKIYRQNGETGIPRRYYSHSYGAFDSTWQADDGDTSNTLNMRMTYTPAPPTIIYTNLLFNWLKNKNKLWFIGVK